MTLNLQTNQI